MSIVFRKMGDKIKLITFLTALFLSSSLSGQIVSTDKEQNPGSEAPTPAKKGNLKRFYEISQSKDYLQHHFTLHGAFANYSLAVHTWSVGSTKQVITSHGYTDACAYLKPLHTWLLEQNYDVTCIELPGHGESSGPRADINNFADYQGIVEQIIPQLKKQYIHTVFYGHSTGSVAMTQTLLAQKDPMVDEVILAAPLIRSYLWDMSVKTYNLLKGAIEFLPRKSVSKGHPVYDELYVYDPAPIKKVPLHWFKQLLAWNKQLESRILSSNFPVHVIFAENDKVIDTAFNKSFIENHFPQAQFYSIPNSGHVFHYGKKDSLEVFYATLDSLLK